MSTSYFDFFDSIIIPRLVGEAISGAGQIIFNDEIRGSTGGGNSVSFRPATTGADVQVFTSNGTWNKPAGVTVVNVLMIGGGGGGGAGARQSAAATAAPGGASGVGGYMVRNAFALASALPSTVTVSVGAGGNGGAARTTNGGTVQGTQGGASQFGTYFGVRGGNGAANGGTGTTAGPVHGSSDLPGAYGSGTSNFSTYGFFAASGGGGAPKSGGTFSPGITAGSSILGVPVQGGQTSGANGTAAPTSTLPGVGSGGGAGGGPGVRGGNGGANGGGAGGGGGGSSTTSGAGGTGGSGIVVVISW